MTSAARPSLYAMAALALVLLGARSARAAWSMPQSNGANGTNSTALTVTMTVTAGNLLIGVGSTTGGTDAGVTDTVNGAVAWQTGNDCVLTGTTRHTRIFWFINTAGGSTTISYHPNAGTASPTTFSVGEYTNTGVSGAALDVQATCATNASSSTPSATTAAVAASGELIIGSVATSAAVTISVGASYTIADTARPAGAGLNRGAMEFNLAGTSGAQTVNWTTSVATGWAAGAAAFKIVSGGAAIVSTTTRTRKGVGP